MTGFVSSTEVRAFVAFGLPCLEITINTQDGERIRLALDDDDAGVLIDQLLQATSDIEFSKEGALQLPELQVDAEPTLTVEGADSCTPPTT